MEMSASQEVEAPHSAIKRSQTSLSSRMNGIRSETEEDQSISPEMSRKVKGMKKDTVGSVGKRTIFPRIADTGSRLLATVVTRQDTRQSHVTIRGLAKKIEPAVKLQQSGSPMNALQ